MEKQILNPPALAAPTGYAHGISTTGGRLLFLSGQPGMDASGKIVARGNLVAQFTQALRNLQVVVEAGGGAMTDVVKFTIYVKDKRDYAIHRQELGQIWQSFFGRYYMAMTLVEVSALFDDEALVEIDGMAVIG